MHHYLLAKEIMDYLPEGGKKIKKYLAYFNCYFTWKSPAFSEIFEFRLQLFRAINLHNLSFYLMLRTLQKGLFFSSGYYREGKLHFLEDID